ncbi:MAG: hypothetical protein J0H68_09320 [Sphingobacteriia bacterium]|nr:hypothetical protein [Sphingobacteriia bacterium]
MENNSSRGLYLLAFNQNLHSPILFHPHSNMAFAVVKCNGDLRNLALFNIL